MSTTCPSCGWYQCATTCSQVERQYIKTIPDFFADEDITFRLTATQDRLLSLQVMTNDFPLTWNDVQAGSVWYAYWQLAVLARDLPNPEPYRQF
jgi:hypothetical protein